MWKKHCPPEKERDDIIQETPMDEICKRGTEEEMRIRDLPVDGLKTLTCAPVFGNGGYSLNNKRVQKKLLLQAR